MSDPALEEELRESEHRRLRALVEVRFEELDALHAPDCALVQPDGAVWDRDQHLGGVARGEVDHLRLEITSPVDVLVGGDLAVLRYDSAVETAVDGGPARAQRCRNTVVWAEDADLGWRVRWAQATAVTGHGAHDHD